MTEIPPPPDPADAIVAAFLARARRAIEQGGLGPIEDYLAAFPGHEDTIRSEYDRLQAAPSPEETAAKRIRQYRFLRPLGRGGQATVWLAEDERHGRRVAIKVLRSNWAHHRDLHARFEREARAAARLEHPHICPIYESGTEGGSAFIAMRFIPGTTLAENADLGPSSVYLDLASSEAAASPALGDAARGPRRSRSPQDLQALVRLFEQIARAIAYAHEQGVLHRDIKPGNIMVGPDGAPVLLDFGLARAAEESAEPLTQTGDQFGTPPYMAPEQIREGPKGVDARTDVYALGVTLFECLSGRRPFERETRSGLFAAILYGTAPSLRRLAPEVSRDLAAIVDRAMHPARDRRYPDARALAADLGAHACGRPVLARPLPRWERALRRARLHRTLSAALVALAVVVVATAITTTKLWNRSAQANATLADHRDEIALGLATRKRERVDSLIAKGFQLAFGLEALRAPDAFEAALDIEPQATAAEFGLIFSRLAVAPDDHALAAIRQRFSTAPPALFAMIEGYLEVRFFMTPLQPERARRAQSHFRRAIELAERPRFHYWHAAMMIAHRLGDAPSLDTAERALCHHWPDNPATWEAIAQFRLGRDEARAVFALRRILELRPSASAWLGLAQWHLQNDRWDAARAAFAEAETLGPHLAFVPLMLGQALEARGERASALAAYRRALHRKPVIPGLEERVRDWR